MAKHKLKKSQQFIDGITELGKTMGYYVLTEFPVLPATKGTPMAVDVAWFRDNLQPYPLLIFEVESRPSNTIPNNVFKVFAQETKEFEKPLFFFHIILGSSINTPRLQLLESQYRTQNYCVYRLNKDDGSKLLKDILRQHWRINKELNIVSVYDIIAGTEWKEYVDPLTVLQEANILRLSTTTQFANKIQLARRHSKVRELLPEMIKNGLESNWNLGEFRTFLGIWFTPALLMAWMIGNTINTEQDYWDDQLRKWQNETYFLPMFCSDLELSQDYAEFLLSTGGPFAALIVGLCKTNGNSSKMFLDVLLEVLDKVRDSFLGFQSALWACHISSRMNNQIGFEKARDFLNSLGGVAKSDLVEPPSMISINEHDFKKQCDFVNKEFCPTMSDFIKLVANHNRVNSVDATSLLLWVLDDETASSNWNVDILQVLWSDFIS